MSNPPIITPSAGGGNTVLTGDVTGSGAGTIATILAMLGGLLQARANIVLTPITDSTTLIKITQADGATVVFTLDTTNRRFGIGSGSLSVLFNVFGNARIDGQLAMGPSTAGASCLIDMQNPFAGCGLPYMTQVQRRALSPHRNGNLIFCTDTNGGDGPGLYYDDGTVWNKVTATPANA